MDGANQGKIQRKKILLKRYPLSFWQEILKEFEGGTLSAYKFCLKKGIGFSTFLLRALLPENVITGFQVHVFLNKLADLNKIKGFKVMVFLAKTLVSCTLGSYYKSGRNVA